MVEKSWSPKTQRSWVSFSSLFINDGSFYQMIFLKKEKGKGDLKVLFVFNSCLRPQVTPTMLGGAGDTWVTWFILKAEVNVPEVTLSHGQMVTQLLNQVAIQWPFFVPMWMYWLHKCLSSYSQSTILGGWSETCTRHRSCPQDVLDMTQGERSPYVQGNVENFLGEQEHIQRCNKG